MVYYQRNAKVDWSDADMMMTYSSRRNELNDLTRALTGALSDPSVLSTSL